jgi:hypothetical protein
MIELTLKSKRIPEKKGGWFNPVNKGGYMPPALPNHTSTALTSNTEMFNEAQRRDKIIRERIAQIKYKEGDHVKPWCQKEIDVYGDDIVVIKICDTYAKFGKNEKWPANDYKLMLIHAFSRKTKENFWCTPLYLVPKT